MKCSVVCSCLSITFFSMASSYNRPSYFQCKPFTHFPCARNKCAATLRMADGFLFFMSWQNCDLHREDFLTLSKYFPHLTQSITFLFLIMDILFIFILTLITTYKDFCLYQFYLSPLSYNKHRTMRLHSIHCVSSIST